MQMMNRVKGDAKDGPFEGRARTKICARWITGSREGQEN